MVARLPYENAKIDREENFAKYKCPKDCPFLGGVPPQKFCEFALYAAQFELGRYTRTELMEDGSLDYHIPPDCDAYKKYKGQKFNKKKRATTSHYELTQAQLTEYDEYVRDRVYKNKKSTTREKDR